MSRAGEKLAAALDHFQVDVRGLVCADLGSHVGGFVDCLLQRGAGRVYAVDTAYGTLAWKLRRDPRVVVMERTNAMHVTLPEPADLVTIDVGWTPQAKVLGNVRRMVQRGHDDGSTAGDRPDASAGCLSPRVVSLIKPHYEAPKEHLVQGILPDAMLEPTVRGVLDQVCVMGWTVRGTVESCLRGHGGNREVFALLEPAEPV